MYLSPKHQIIAIGNNRIQNGYFISKKIYCIHDADHYYWLKSISFVAIITMNFLLTDATSPE